MRRAFVLAVLLAALVVPWAAWGQRVGTVGQDGEWTIRHIGSVVHIAGAVSLSGGHSLVVSHVSAVLHVAGINVSPQFTMLQQAGCSGTATTILSSATTRRDLIVQNNGTVNIYLGGGHATVTTSNGFALHASSASPFTSKVDLPNFQGPLACIADGPGQTLSIIQIVR